MKIPPRLKWSVVLGSTCQLSWLGFEGAITALEAVRTDVGRRTLPSASARAARAVCTVSRRWRCQTAQCVHAFA